MFEGVLSNVYEYAAIRTSLSIVPQSKRAVGVAWMEGVKWIAEVACVEWAVWIRITKRVGRV